MFEFLGIWQWIWWAWLALLAVFFIGFASQHMKFSKTLSYVVAIIMIYFFVIKHPVWGSIWFILSFIFTTGIFWPGMALFRLGASELIKRHYSDVEQMQEAQMQAQMGQAGLPWQR